MLLLVVLLVLLFPTTTTTRQEHISCSTHRLARGVFFLPHPFHSTRYETGKRGTKGGGGGGDTIIGNSWRTAVAMQRDGRKVGPVLQKFRPRLMQPLADILKPDVLDDETRKQIVRNVMGTEISTCDGCVSPVTETPAPCERNAKEGFYPTSFRDRVSGGNGDLLSSMANRLKTLEAQQQAYRMELREKTEKLVHAEDMFEAEKVKREEAETLVLELFNDMKELEEEVQEMRKFLADYGLHWAGKKHDKHGDKCLDEGGMKTDGAASPSKVSVPFELYAGDYCNETPPAVSRSSTPTYSAVVGVSKGTTAQDCPQHGATNAPPNSDHFPLPASMDVLKRHAKILSDHVGSRGVFCDGKQGGIRELEGVRIVVYQDGITVNDGPFRPFGWPLCDAVLNDLADGYYPYEFKQRYPDGFPVEVVDLMSVRCAATAGANGGGNVKNLQQMQNGGYKTVSREEFLRRLPASRITANGRVIDVRGAIAKMIGGDQQSEDGCSLRHISEAERQITRGVVNETDSDSAGAAAAASGGDVAPPQRVRGMVSVLLRFPLGTKVVLQLAPESTIADLRKEIKAAVPSFTVAYDIRLSFPALTYSDDSKTLRELGLLTSCTLMIQPKMNTSGV